MAVELFANTATTTLAAAITSTGATTLTVASSALFPAAVTATSQFRIKIDDEIMIVTNVAGTTWTVTRGAESTTAATHASAAVVTHVLTAAVLGGLVVSPLVWIAPTLVNSWLNYPTPHDWVDAGYTKTANGLVLVRGLIGGGSADDMFTLPVGYRPPRSIISPIHMAGPGLARIDVTAAGVVKIVSTYPIAGNAATRDYVSLDGIYFDSNS